MLPRFFFFFFWVGLVCWGLTNNSIFFAIWEIGEINSSPSLFWVGTRKVKVNMPWSPFEVFTDKVIKAYCSCNQLVLCLNLIELQASYVAKKLNNPNILNKKKNFVTIYTLNNSEKEKYNQSNVVLAAHDHNSAPHGPHPSLRGLCPIEKEQDIGCFPCNLKETKHMNIGQEWFLNYFQDISCN